VFILCIPVPFVPGEPGESAAHYANDKANFHRLCSEPMSEQVFVGHLISGIKHTQLYWHRHNANLATIAAFVTEYGRLEVVASTAPPVIDPLQGELARLRKEMEAVKRAQANNMPRFQQDFRQQPFPLHKSLG
jgi:hypothetical protein